VDPSRPCIGFAAFQAGVSERDWPGSVWSLREGLRSVADVVDIAIQSPNPGQPALLGPSRSARCDAVLLIDCVASVPEPFFIYSTSQENPTVAASATYERASGLFAESDWRARSLARTSGIARDKIHVVPPALVWRQSARKRAPLRIRQVPRRKLLYICGKRRRRCGLLADQVILDALRILRREYDPLVSLTIAGTEEWPFPGSPPGGVDFRGAASGDAASALIDSHDLFVMPSSLEPFGLAFADALSRGVPCVIPGTCEMFGAITPGISGALVDEGDARELASAIASTLADDEMYQRCYERAPAMAAYFSWERVARQITQVISREVGLMTS
jgi:Glycosyl transferases group 1